MREIYPSDDAMWLNALAACWIVIIL